MTPEEQNRTRIKEEAMQIAKELAIITRDYPNPETAPEDVRQKGNLKMLRLKQLAYVNDLIGNPLPATTISVSPNQFILWTN